MLVNDTHKQAAKAAIARLVVSGASVPDAIGFGVAEAAFKMGLQLGNFSSQGIMARYAEGVRAKGERACNRRWGEYPPEVASLSQKLVERAKAEVQDLLQ